MKQLEFDSQESVIFTKVANRIMDQGFTGLNRIQQQNILLNFLFLSYFAFLIKCKLKLWK